MFPAEIGRKLAMSALDLSFTPAIDIAARLADLIGGFVPSPGYQG